jgi:hypothetical protein
VALRQLAQRRFAAADEDRLDRQARAVGQRHAALVPQGKHRAHEVLPVAHPPGHAVHHDPEGRECAFQDAANILAAC